MPRRRDSSTSLRSAIARQVLRLAHIAHFLKTEFFFERPAKLSEVVLIHAGVDSPHRLKVDAEPSGMQCFSPFSGSI